MSRQDWTWCGAPHHFIGGNDCRFHLATWVADRTIMVSTVGEYLPRSRSLHRHPNAHPEHDWWPLGADPTGYYETAVFRTDPATADDQACGNPVPTDWEDLVMIRSATADIAIAIHEQQCLRYELLPL